MIGCATDERTGETPPLHGTGRPDTREIRRYSVDPSSPGMHGRASSSLKRRKISAGPDGGDGEGEAGCPASTTTTTTPAGPDSGRSAPDMDAREQRHRQLVSILQYHLGLEILQKMRELCVIQQEIERGAALRELLEKFVINGMACWLRAGAFARLSVVLIRVCGRFCVWHDGGRRGRCHCWRGRPAPECLGQ